MNNEKKVQVHRLQYTATDCNTQQQTAIYYDILQHTVTHCNTLRRVTDLDVWHAIAPDYFYVNNEKKLHVTDCTRLQQTATDCNAL